MTYADTTQTRTKDFQPMVVLELFYSHNLWESEQKFFATTYARVYSAVQHTTYSYIQENACKKWNVLPDPHQWKYETPTVEIRLDSRSGNMVVIR